MNLIRPLRALALIIVIAASSSACAAASPADDGVADPDDLVAAAKQEGQLTLYGDGGEPTLQAWTKGFTDEYGISVNILRLAGSELSQRFAQEKSTGQNLADVYSSTDRVTMDKAVDSGWIDKYEPESGGQWPKDQRRDGYYYPVQNGYYMAVAYNTDLLTDDEVSEIRKDPIGAAGDPAFLDRVAVGVPQASQHAAAFHYLQTDNGRDWSRLADIAANKPLTYVSTLTMLQNLIAGEYAVAVAVTDSLIAPQILDGAPIEFAYPLQTTGGFFNTGVVADAPHPNAARLFMDWATSAEADALYTDITQTIPANTDVVDDRELTKSDWYAEPDQDRLWLSWTNDKPFLDASGADGDFLDRWSEVFGYSG